MLVKLEKPVMFIPDIYAKSKNRYNEKLFNFLSFTLDKIEKEAMSYQGYPTLSKDLLKKRQYIPWFLFDKNEDLYNSFIGLDKVSLGKEGDELDPQLTDIDFYRNIQYVHPFGSADQMGVSVMDMKIIADVDKYIKSICEIHNTLIPWFCGKDSVNEKENISKEAINIVDLLEKHNVSNKVDGTKEAFNIADIVLSNTNKPYEFVPKSNILFVIAKTGFTNLLKGYLNSFSILLYSDIVREYRSAFGAEELESSLLFSKYLLKHETIKM